MLKILLRESSFARAIRISTLPTRFSSLASGVSILDMLMLMMVMKMMMIDFASVSHDNDNNTGRERWNSRTQRSRVEKGEEFVLNMLVSFEDSAQADAACVLDDKVLHEVRLDSRGLMCLLTAF